MLLPLAIRRTPAAGHRHALQLLTHLERNRDRLSPLLILTHDFPDPDALASAWGLQCLAAGFGIESRIAYGGVITRAENRAMVKRLRMPAHRLASGDLAQFRSVALVDTQPRFENNPFPANRRAAIVIDQHAPVAPVLADLSLVDTGCGATCVIVAQAVLLHGGEMSSRLATAFAYGILSDTLDLYRAEREDVVQTYLRVLRRSDMRALAEIQNPQRSRRFFTTLSRGLQTAVACRRVMVAHLGAVSSPEDVAHVADFLLTYDRADWSLCTGRLRGNLYLSLRSEIAGAQAGDLLRKVVGDPSHAGGHGGIAGGKLVVDNEPTEARWRAAERSMQERLAAQLKLPAGAGFRRVFE